jgi:pimeloyl-ACP methyl ester carboxylesterase
MRKIIFIPGLLGNAHFWNPIIKKLSPDYQCQVLDISRGDSIEEWAQRVWDKTEDEAILVGFSLGAWIACYAALLSPNRCRGIVLISSAPGSLREPIRALFESYTQQIQSGQFEAFLEDDFSQDVAPMNQGNVLLKERFMSMAQKQSKDTAISQLKSMIQFKGFKDLSYIKCPTLLLRGAYDKSVNITRQEEMLKEISMTELGIVPDAAHYIPLENPGVTLQSIRDWLIRNNL